MGSAQSVDSSELDPDPWWPSTGGECRNHAANDDVTRDGVLGHCDAWEPREKDLCRTIQHLAQENMHLATFKKEMEHEVALAQLVHTKDRITIAKLKNDIVMLTQQLTESNTGAGTVVDKVMQTEVEVDLGNEQQLRALSLQNEESVREIDSLRRELDAKCEALEEISAQLVLEKNTSKVLLAETEKLREEMQSIGASQANEATGRASDEVPLPRESSDKQSSSDRDGRVACELERFKAEMSVKREARQRAMAAISMEMERLRSELAAERESNQRLAKEFERSRAVKKCDHEGYEELYTSLERERERNGQLTTRNECLSNELDDTDRSLATKTSELEDLRTQFETERDQYNRKISSLKEVVSISKQLLSIRERQVDDLQLKLDEVRSLAGNERENVEQRVNSACSQVAEGLRREYQAQLENIKSLRALYDERMRVMSEEKDKISADYEEAREKLEAEQKKCEELQTELTDVKSSLSQWEETTSSLETQLDESRDEARGLARELTLINNVFTQMLVSSNGGSEVDLDKLTRSLQENHDLISEITLKEASSDLAACLPKLLLELVAEVEKTAQASDNTTEQTVEEKVTQSSDNTAEGIVGEKVTQSSDNTTEEIVEEKVIQSSDNTTEEVVGEKVTQSSDNTTGDTAEEMMAEGIQSVGETNHEGDESGHNMAAEDIASNLPKVWKVLTELLSHHAAPTERPSDTNDDCCYKRVDTPYGPRLAISVSKTFLRLKDLILEKKSLRRELMQLKQLNCHLENRLSEQEQRLSLVSSELHKTWSVVGRMRTQHQQLHNHEKILRYELQQKRKLLTELKQELEYCRETWEMAREKNSQSEEQWRNLRKEFAARKKGSSTGSLDNSAESGFSDDKEDDSGGEQERTYTDTFHGPSEQQPRHEDATPLRSDMVTPALVPLEAPLMVDVTHEQFLSEEVCPLKSPVTPQFVESSAHVTVHDGDSAADTAVLVECPVEKYCGLECSTISLIALLKQQLSCFSRNLEEITSDFGSDDNHQALQSIFFLPDIKVTYYEQRSDISKVKCANCSRDIFTDVADTENVPSDASDKKKQCSFVLSESATKKETSNVDNEPLSSSQSCVADIQLTQSQNNEVPSSTDGESHVEGSELCDKVTKVDATPKRFERTPEQVMEAREARLRRLEEQCRQLVTKVTNTTNRSVVLSSRLEELHGQYGIPDPPPCPNVLPSLRIPQTTVSNTVPPPPMPQHIPALRIPTQSPTPAVTQTAPSRQPDSLEGTMSPNPDT